MRWYFYIGIACEKKVDLHKLVNTHTSTNKNDLAHNEERKSILKVLCLIEREV